MDNILYVKMRHRVEVENKREIKVKDIAVLVGPERILKEVEDMTVYHIIPEDQNLVILDSAKLIKAVIGQKPDIEIQLIGLSQTIIEVIIKKRKHSVGLFIIVWFLLFVGAAIAIMNFHEDVSMQEVHQKLYKLITGRDVRKPLIMQIPYSFGLGAGMILFFNHFFKKKFNDEPSPLEVEIFNYQQDLDQYVIMHENKENIKHIHDH
ncbi:stage V sporulation protein AA [Peribacillus deserti]|uniref:Stage V sporulation protein AA n=1 Tax=Peribacillus deserti TaxID=673318 RepID=A0A2N5M1Q0_9BACI|nr:stage V sporulation protein AA [Peribacillus deserti]PLT28272.1 stage V sporulation protein AA [Peribacillus deserti]